MIHPSVQCHSHLSAVQASEHAESLAPAFAALARHKPNSNSWEESWLEAVDVTVGTVAGRPGTLADTAGSAVAVRYCGHSLAFAVAGNSPVVFAPAWDCTKRHSWGTAARLSVAEDRAHIGRLCTAATASCGCGGGP